MAESTIVKWSLMNYLYYAGLQKYPKSISNKNKSSPERSDNVYF